MGESALLTLCILLAPIWIFTLVDSLFNLAKLWGIS
jgi:hypothetical protein